MIEGTGKVGYVDGACPAPVLSLSVPGTRSVNRGRFEGIYHDVLRGDSSILNILCFRVFLIARGEAFAFVDVRRAVA